MRRTVRLAVGALAVGGSALIGVQPASAQTVDCTDDEVAAAYPDVCVDDDVVDDGAVDGDDDGGVAGGSGGAGLPRTGDEVLILSLAGAGALALGTGLVVAGRRRSSKTA